MPARICLLVLLAAAGVAPAASAQAASAQATYRIDPAHSRIVYAMSHPAHDWTGTSTHVAGTLTVARGAVTGGRVQAPVNSFSSGNRSRDAHMAEATESSLYPTVAFAARTVTMLPAAQQTATRNATVAGTLTFHNVAQAVSVPVRVDVANGLARLVGDFEVTLTQFQIDRPSLLGVRTRDWIGLHLDLAARPG